MKAFIPGPAADVVMPIPEGTLLSSLPTRANKTDPTSGILAANGEEVSLTSGVNGPAAGIEGGAGSGFDAYTRTHVEGHAAAWMQQNDVTEGTLYINNPPCTNCTRNLPRMLPAGATLRVIAPNGYDRIFNSIRIRE
jgi:hypothetical protein